MLSLDEFLASAKTGGAGGSTAAAGGDDVQDQLRQRQLMVESGNRHTNPDGSLVRSSAGALGIAQIMPATARDPGFGVKPLANWDDPQESIRFRDDYMAALTEHFGGDVNKALAAYNGGAGNVEKASARRGENWLTGMPKESQQYVQKITGGVPTEIQAAVKATVTPRRSALPGPIGNPMTGSDGGNPMAGSSIGSQMHDTGGVDLAGAQDYAEQQKRTALGLVGAQTAKPARPAIFDELEGFQMGKPQGDVSWLDYGKAGVYTGAQFAKGVIGLPENLLRVSAGDETSAPQAVAGMGADALAMLRRNLTAGSEAIVQSMSPEAQARAQRRWTQLTGDETMWQGGPGEILSSMALQSTMSLGPTVGPLLSAAALSRIGLGSAVSTVYGASEGVVSGGLTAAQIADDIDSTPTEQLMQVPRFKQLVDAYGEPKARDMYIGEVQQLTPLLSGIATGLLAKAIGKPLDEVFGIGKGLTIGKRALRTGTVEAAQEVPQSAQEQLMQNYAKMAYDSETGLFDDVWESAVQGGALGFMMGGGVGAAFGNRPQKDSRLPQSDKPAPPNVPTSQQGENAPTPPMPPMPTRQRALPLDWMGNAPDRGPQLRPGETQGEMFPLGQEPSFLDERAKRDLLIQSQQMSPSEFAALPEVQQAAKELGTTVEEIVKALYEGQPQQPPMERFAERDRLAPIDAGPDQMGLFNQPPEAGPAPDQGELFPGALPGNIAGDQVSLPRLDGTRGLGYTMGQSQRELPMGHYPDQPGPPSDGGGGGGALDQSIPPQLQVPGTAARPTTTAEIPLAMQPKSKYRSKRAQENYVPEQREVYDPAWLANALATVDKELRKRNKRIGKAGNALHVAQAKGEAAVDFSTVDPRQVKLSPEIQQSLERLAAMDMSTAAPTVANSQQGDLFTGMPTEPTPTVREKAPPRQVVQRGQPAMPTGEYRVTVSKDVGRGRLAKRQVVESTIFDSQEIAEEYANGLSSLDPNAYITVEPERAREEAPGFAPVPDLSRIPDFPSAESYKRIVAQIRESGQDSSRVGTYLPAETIAHLRRIGKYDEVRSMGITIPNFDKKGGDMVMPDRSTADAALKYRDEMVASGQDFQRVLGVLTGSGVGKPAGADKVVQRLNADGVVVAEQLVADNEIPRVEANFKMDPGTVRVIPAVQAIKERQAEVIDEAQMGDVAGEARQEGYKRRATGKRVRRAVEEQLSKASKLGSMRADLLDLESPVVGEEVASEDEAATKLANYAQNLREEEETRAKKTGYSNPDDLVFFNRYVSKDGTEQEEEDTVREKQYAGLWAALANAKNDGEITDAKNKLDAFLRIHRPVRRSVFVAEAARKVSSKAVAAEKRLERKTIGSEDRSPSRYVLAKDSAVDRAFGDQMATSDEGGRGERVQATAPEAIGEAKGTPLRTREADRTRPQTLATLFPRLDFGSMTPTAARHVKKLFTYINPESGQTSASAREIPSYLAQWLTDYRNALIEAARKNGQFGPRMAFKVQRVRRDIGIVSEALRNLRNADTAGNQMASTVEQAVPPDSAVARELNDADIKQLDSLIGHLNRKIKDLQDKLEKEASAATPTEASLSGPAMKAAQQASADANAEVISLYGQMEGIRKSLEKKEITAAEANKKLFGLKAKHRAAMKRWDETSAAQHELFNRLVAKVEADSKEVAPSSAAYRQISSEIDNLSRQRDAAATRRTRRVATIYREAGAKSTSLGLDVGTRAAAVVAKNIYDLVSNASRYGVGEQMKHTEFNSALDGGPAAFLKFLKENTRSRDPQITDWTKEELDQLPEESINELFLEAIGKQATKRLTDSREPTIIAELANARIWTAEEALRVVEGTAGKSLPEVVRNWIVKDLRGPGKRWFTMEDMIRMYHEFWPKFAHDAEFSFVSAETARGKSRFGDTLTDRDVTTGPGKVGTMDRSSKGGTPGTSKPLPGWEAIDEFALTPQKSVKIKQILRSQEYEKDIMGGRGEKGYGLTREATEKKSDIEGLKDAASKRAEGQMGAYDYRVLTEQALPTSVVDSKARLASVQAQGDKVYGKVNPDGTRTEGTLELALKTSQQFTDRVRNEYSAFQRIVKKAGKGTDTSRDLTYALAFYRQVQAFARSMLQARPLTERGIKTAQQLEQDLLKWAALAPQDFAAALSTAMEAEMRSNVNKTVYADKTKLAGLRDREKSGKQLKAFNSELVNSIAKAAKLRARALDPRYTPILDLLDKYALDLGRTGYPSYNPTDAEAVAVAEALDELTNDPTQANDLTEVANLLANFGFYNQDVALLRKSNKLYGGTEQMSDRDVLDELDAALGVSGHVRTGGGVNRERAAELAREAQNEAEAQGDSAPSPFESSQLEEKLLGSTDDVRTGVKAAVDIIENPGLSASLHEVLVRLNLHLDGSHPFQYIISKMMKLQFLDVEVMFDRRRGARATNWKPKEMGRTVWYRDTPDSKVKRMIVLRSEAFQKLRDSGVDPAAAMLHMIVHEGSHVATAAAIDANPQLKAALRQLMDIVAADLAKKGVTHVPYGLNSEHEFIAEAHGNSVFQGVLRRVKLSEHLTAWGRFKQIVKDALGWVESKFAFAEQQDNVLEAVMALTPELFTGANRNLIDKYVAESIQSDAMANVPAMAWDRAFKSGEAVGRVKDLSTRMFRTVTENFPDHALSALTLRQLDEFFGVWFRAPGETSSGPLSRYIDTHFRRDYDTNVRANKADKGSRSWTALEESNPEAAQKMSQLMIDSTFYGIYPNLPFNHQKNSHLKGPVAQQRHSELNAVWNSLQGTGAQTVFEEILAQNEAVVAERTSLMVLNALRAYSLDHKLYEAEAFDRKYVVDPETGRDDVVRLKLNTLEGIQKEFGDIFTTETKATADKPASEVFDLAAVKTILKMAATPTRHAGPYFTVQRFGDYVVSARKEVGTQVFQSRKERTAYKAKRRMEDPTVQFWQPSAMDEKGMKDGADFVLKEFEYEVRRRENASEAEIARQELVAKYGAENVSKQPQLTHNWMQGKATIENNEQLQTLMRKLGDNTAAKAALKHFYLQSLAENSFRKYEMNRKNVRGALAKEMHRGYNSYMRGAAYYVAQLRYGHKLARYMSQTTKAAEANEAGAVSTVTLQRIAKELQRRDERATDPTEIAPIIRKTGEIAQLVLLFTPSYWVLNAMQGYMFTLPYVGARYGEAATLAEMLAVQNMIKHPILTQAVTSVAGLRGLFKGGRTVLDNAYTVLDEVEDNIIARTSAEEGKRLKEMLETLKHESIITMTMQTELRQIALGENTGWFERVMDATRIMPHLTEVNNRVTAAMTAYRLAYARAVELGQDESIAHKGAIAYAKEVVTKTHFDYSPSNRAPLFANHPLLTQFMTYVQHTYAMFIGAAYRYFRTADPQARAEIRKMVYGVLGTHLAVGGVVAATFQPIKWAIGLAIALLDSDDDEDETWANIFKGETFNRHVRYAFDAMFGRDVGRGLSLGLPAALGANVSPRVTIGQLYMIDVNTETSEGFWGSMVQSFGGAWTAVFNNVVVSYNHLQNGNPYRALESSLPKGLKDLMKTARMYEGGLTDNSGKVILNAKDLDFGDLFLTSIGVTPTRLTEKQTARAELYEAKRFRGKRRTTLMNEWYRSTPAQRVELWDKIREFGKKFPEHAISRSDLIKGEKRWKDASRRTLLTGAPLTDREAPLAEEEKVYEYD